MLSILAVTFPFFALVLCGYLAARRQLLPLAAIPGLNSFVLYFALPALLFQLAARTPLQQLLDGVLLACYLLAAAVLVTLSVALARRQGRSWNDAAMGALVAVFPNSGFMGVPLLVALLGEAASGPIILLVAADMVITSSVCIALSRLDGAEGSGLQAMRQALGKALRGVLGNPMAWAILLGAGFTAQQWVLPAVLDKTVSLLANAATPVALFTIGAVLARANMVPQSARHADGGWRDPAGIAAIKLVLHPLLVLGACMLVRRAGLSLSDLALQVLVMAAALPSASNVSLLAERLGADNTRVARVILLSTLASFVSFALVTQWMRP